MYSVPSLFHNAMNATGSVCVLHCCYGFCPGEQGRHSTSPAACEGVLSVREGLLLRALSVHVHVPVEPLRVVKSTLYENTQNQQDLQETSLSTPPSVHAGGAVYIYIFFIINVFLI